MFIGSDANGYGKNYIAFYGTTGDQPGEYTHTYIGENLWGGTESSELVLFKGNDIASQVNTVSNSGGDRIRHIAAGHLFQIYNLALSGTFQDICQSTTPINVFEINKQGIMVTMQNDATFKVYANTNTSYGYETVSLQTAFDAKDPETSGYPASYGHRCTMLLQPLGGQVYIGSNLTTLADSNYKLYVNGNTNIQGQLKIYTNTLFAYDNTDQYLQYTGESYVDSHAGRIDLYKIIASGTAGVAGTKTETISLRAATGDIYASGSIRNLSTSGGIYWSPYVESATDASDAASIYLIKSGAAGGTELRISIANDATDIINLHTPKFIYINEKKVFTVNDTWLRINEDSGYSSGICTGTSLVRSDNALQVGENGSHFYANSSGNGYIQNTFGVHGTDTTKHFFVNGTSRFADDITMDNGSEILFSTNTQYLRWTTDISNNNSTGRSWYGIGTYQNTSDSNNSWLNISNYLGINITTKGTTYLRHNNNIIATTGNQTGTVGSATRPIYSRGGVLMASSSTVGSGVQPIFLSSGNITASESTVGSAINPIFMSAGKLSASTATVGSGVRGIYLNAGAITAMTYELGANIKAYSGSLSSGGWAALNGKGNAPSIAIAYNNSTASWNSSTYSASLVFGCQDTRGLLDCAYNTPIVTFGGCSYGGASNDAPNWYMKLSGTNGKTYTLPTDSKTLCASDGTNASGTWGISISGSAATALTVGQGNDPDVALDANNIIVARSKKTFYVTNTDKMTNRPSGTSWGYLDVGSYDNNGTYMYQTFIDGGNANMYVRVKNNSTWEAWTKILTDANYGNIADNRYVKKSGDTMTGMLQVNNAPIFGYRYRQSNNAPAFVFDKPSSHYTGIGANGNADTIYFGAVTTDGSWNWVTSYKQKWVFNGDITADKVYGAVWNDYAEYRSTSTVNPGQCVVETGLGDLIQSTKRLQSGANIVSDTYGFAIGETEQTKTPLAVSGRVLAYPYEDRYSYSAGDPVCSGPNGTISKMTREEVREYPDRIVGTVSEIPEYETWGTGNVKVNGRIWIKVR